MFKINVCLLFNLISITLQSWLSEGFNELYYVTAEEFQVSLVH